MASLYYEIFKIRNSIFFNSRNKEKGENAAYLAYVTVFSISNIVKKTVIKFVSKCEFFKWGKQPFWPLPMQCFSSFLLFLLHFKLSITVTLNVVNACKSILTCSRCFVCFLKDFTVPSKLINENHWVKKKKTKSILKSSKGYCFVGTQLYIFVFCLPTINWSYSLKPRFSVCNFILTISYHKNTQVYLHLERHKLLQFYPPSVCLTAILQTHHMCVCQSGDQFHVSISIFVVIIIVQCMKKLHFCTLVPLKLNPSQSPNLCCYGEWRSFWVTPFLYLYLRMFVWSLNCEQVRNLVPWKKLSTYQIVDIDTLAIFNTLSRKQKSSTIKD